MQVTLHPGPVGLVVHDLSAATRAKLDELGVKRVRMTVYYYLWKHDIEYRALVTEYLASSGGLDLILVLHSGVGAKGDLEGFVEFLVQIHNLAPKAALQLWNEVDSPNGPGNGWLHFAGDPELYGKHVQVVRDRLPDAVLVGAGLSGSGEDLKRWVRALDASPVDVIAVHTYGFPVVLSWREKARVVREITDKPVWNTEVGIELAAVPEDLRGDWGEQQAHLLRESITEPLYDRAYIYVLQDGVPNGHSILGADGSLRPAAVMLREWNGGR